MSKQTLLVKNTLIIAIGKLSTQFLMFLLLPVYTIFLTPEDFGQIDIVLLYVSLLAPTLTIQMEMAVFRHLIDARGKFIETSRAIASSSLVLFTGAVFGAISIMTVGALFNITFAGYLTGLFLSVVFLSYFLQLARGLGRNDLYAIASIVTGLTTIIITCAALMIFKAGVEGVLLAGIIGNGAGVTMLIVMTNYPKYLRVESITRKELGSLLTYAWPLVPTHIGFWGIGGVSRTIIAIALGAAAMGVFAASSRFSLIYTSLYLIFAMSWTEAVSVYIKEKKDSFISDTSDVVVRFFGSLGILITAFVALLFPLFVSRDFNDARLYIPILILGAFLNSLVNHYGALYLAMRKTKQAAAISIQAIIISSVLTVVGISFMGLYAPALALVVTYAYLVVQRHRDVQKYVDIKYKKFTYPILTAFAIAVTVLYYLNNIYASTVAVLIAVVGFLIINRKSLNSAKKMVLGRYIKLKQ